MTKKQRKRDASAMPAAFNPRLTPSDPLAAYWIGQATVRLRREVSWLWAERGGPTGATALPPFADPAVASLDLTRFERQKQRFFAEDETARYLSDLLDSSPPRSSAKSPRGSYSWIVHHLELDDVAAFALALVMLPSYDGAASNVLATCLNDPRARRATLSLVQQLWGKPDDATKLMDPWHPLYRYGLVRADQRTVGSGIEVGSGLSTPSAIVDLILHGAGTLPRILEPTPRARTRSIESILHGEFVASILAAETRPTQGFVVPVLSQAGSDASKVAGTISEAANRSLVRFVGGERTLRSQESLDTLATACWLVGNDLFIGPEWRAGLNDSHSERAPLVPTNSIPVVTYLAVEQRSDWRTIPESSRLPAVEPSALSHEQRVGYLTRELGIKSAPMRQAIGRCCRRYRFEDADLERLVSSLKARKRLRTEHFEQACVAQLELDLGDTAERIRPRFELADVVLPDKQGRQLSEIKRAIEAVGEVHDKWGTGRVWGDAGIAVLFSGSSGTGKTMSAEALAQDLGLPLFRVDLAQIVSKYIGETNRNLRRLFDACDATDLVLFFDEADALFGRRTQVKDSHDRYANQEISYLLQRMERAKGLTILATNRKEDLDVAFMRRLRYVVDFPQPGVKERQEIWRRSLPDGVDCSELDLAFLAQRFPLSGGQIRSVLFNACLQCAWRAPGERRRRARLRMEPVLLALKRELDKLNRSTPFDSFGTHGERLRRIEQQPLTLSKPGRKS